MECAKVVVAGRLVSKPDGRSVLRSVEDRIEQRLTGLLGLARLAAADIHPPRRLAQAAILPPPHLATGLNSPPDDGKLRNFRQIVHLSLDIRHTTTEHVLRTVRQYVTPIIST